MTQGGHFVKPIRTIGALVATAALAAPATAAAHITVQPNTAAAGGFTRLDVRVPNERDDASTTKVQLQLPDGFVFASYEPTPGWTVKVDKKTLDKPIQTDDGEVTEQVSEITWTGHGAQGRIPPGAFRDFGLSVQVPGKEGDELTFKAIQAYSSGEIVRWIGDESSDTPAPKVTVTAAAGEEHAAAPATPAPSEPASATASDDGGSDTLSVVALVVGALGLVAGGTALMASRRSLSHSRA
jgi:periplasmic copper chaperone A